MQILGSMGNTLFDQERVSVLSVAFNANYYEDTVISV